MKSSKRYRELVFYISQGHPLIWTVTKTKSNGNHKYFPGWNALLSARLVGIALCFFS
jgi:hypothetical protein